MRNREEGRGKNHILYEVGQTRRRGIKFDDIIHTVKDFGNVLVGKFSVACSAAFNV